MSNVTTTQQFSAEQIIQIIQQLVNQNKPKFPSPQLPVSTPSIPIPPIAIPSPISPSAPKGITDKMPRRQISQLANLQYNLAPVEVSGTVITESLSDINSALIEENLIQVLLDITEVTFTAGQTITSITANNPNTVILTAEIRVYVDTDHAFSVKEVIDNKVIIINDTDVVQAHYIAPLDAFKLGVVPVRSQVATTITNILTSGAATISVETIEALISTQNWEKIVKNYFKTLVRETGVS